MVTNVNELWDTTLSHIQTRISKPSFETWLKATKASSLDDSTLLITAPNEFTRDWLESRYSELISETLYEVTGKVITIKFVIPTSNSQQNENDIDSVPSSKANRNNLHDDYPQTMLNSKYTFDTFVIGAGNRFAHAASLQSPKHLQRLTIRSLFMGA